MPSSVWELDLHANRSRLNKPCSYPVIDAESPRLVPVPELGDLTPPNIRRTLEEQVSSIVGDGRRLQEVVDTYFRTVHVWLPVVYDTAYYARLSKFRTQPASSGFSVLTLCMFLVCAMPVDGELSAETRSLYILVKSFVATLEAMDTNSLEVLQARLLLTVFEIGHAIYPAAYISAGANLRAAIALGASAASSKDLCKVFPNLQQAEEARRTWRGIVIVDRLLFRLQSFAHSLLSGKRIDISPSTDTPPWRAATSPALFADDKQTLQAPILCVIIITIFEVLRAGF